jgi:hypothetical protein
VSSDLRAPSRVNRGNHEQRTTKTQHGDPR